MVPSLTELLMDLGLQQQLAGRTRFCIHPEDRIDRIAKVGGTKNPRIEKILDKDPDFVLANLEENRKEDVDRLRRQTRVHVTDIPDVEAALQAITTIGKLMNRAGQAGDIRRRAEELLAQRPDVRPLRTAYFIWKKPWMTVGGDTYIHDVMRLWQLENLYGGQTRYPEVDLNELSRLDPELILLSSEPFPFDETSRQELQQQFPGATIELVDGQWFSWYGSRMTRAFAELNAWRSRLVEALY